MSEPLAVRKVCILGDGMFVPVQNLVRFLRSRGVEVHVVTFGEQGFRGGVHVHRIRVRSRPALVMARTRIARLVARIAPDVVHAFYLTSYGYLATGIRRVPVLVTAMGSDVFGAPDLSIFLKPIRRLLARRALRHSTRIHSVADHMTREIVGLGGVPSKVMTFPRGVDTELFGFRPRPLGETRLSLISNRKLEPVYDPEVIIRAALRLRDTNVDFRLVICGDGYLRPRLEERCVELRLGDFVKFVGRVSQVEVSELLSRSDLYLSASLSDGTSSCLLEAMAVGCIPVVSDIEANRAWVSESPKNGWLFETGSDSELYQAMLRAIESRSEWASIRERNREIVKSRASMSAGHERIMDAYRRMLQSCEPRESRE